MSKRFKNCVILAAGRGKRMQSDLPKVLIPVNGKPVIQYVIDYWKPYVEQFHFILGYKSADVWDYITKSNCRIGSMAVQKEQKGIADAINHDNLRAELHNGTFVVALGDCINLGNFEFPERFELGYGLLKSNYQKQLGLCCSVWEENGKIVRLVEKGRAPYVGIGTYFFDKRVFDYISLTPPSSYRNEVEITEVLQTMVDYGETIKPIFLNGEFINMTYPEDIVYAENILNGRYA